MDSLPTLRQTLSTLRTRSHSLRLRGINDPATIRTVLTNGFPRRGSAILTTEGPLFLKVTAEKRTVVRPTPEGLKRYRI